MKGPWQCFKSKNRIYLKVFLERERGRGEMERVMHLRRRDEGWGDVLEKAQAGMVPGNV